MRIERHLFLMVAAALAVTALWAAEPNSPPSKTSTTGQAAKPDAAKPEAPAAGNTTSSAKPDAMKPEVAKAAADASKADKDKAEDEKSSPKRFIPSEQVRPDFDVSFPIDI